MEKAINLNLYFGNKMFNLIITETHKRQGATWKTIKTKWGEVIRIEQFMFLMFHGL